MTKEVQFRRGTTTQHSTFTGAVAEVTVDTDLDVVVVHDGVTAGGQQMVGRTATQTLTNKTLTSPTISGGTINNASVGATIRSSGAFTTLDANGNVILGSDTADTVTINGLVNSAVTFTGANSHLTLTGELRGPATFVIDPSTVGDNTGTVQIKGNLQVDGTSTVINSTTYTVDDPLIVLADGQTTAAGVDTGGFTLGTTGIGIQYNNSGTRFDSTEDFNLANGKAYEINGTVVLSSSAVLGKTIGGTAAGDIVSIDGTQTLSNKTLTAAKIVNNGFIADANGNEQLRFVTTASAVNDIQITNAATGTAPIIESVGDNTDIDLRLHAKGTGDIVIDPANTLKLAAGTTAKAPLLFATGPLLSTTAGGALEYASPRFFVTPDSGTVGGRGLVHAPHWVRVNANRTKTTNNTALEGVFDAANDTISLITNTLYYMKGFYYIVTAASGTNHQPQIGFSFSNAQADIWYEYSWFTGTAATTTQTSGYNNVATALTFGTSQLASQTVLIKFEGYFKSNATTGGTFVPAFTQSVAGTSVPPTMQAGSWFILQPISGPTDTVIAGTWS